MKQSTSIVLALTLTAGILELSTCYNHRDCKQHPDQDRCQSTGGGHGGGFSGGGSGSGDEAHAVTTGGFGESAGGHGGGGGGE